jgi:uncharacterized protein (TIGR03083 family)
VLLAEYLDHLRVDSADLLDAAAAGADAAVPSCPGWDMASLVGHVAAVHRWVTGMVATRAGERGPFPEPPAGWDALLEWYRAGADELVRTLEAADPAAPVWNWRDRAPAPVAFWHRRMAHETAMHRWDAQLAVGAPSPVEAALAADGVDEITGFVDGWLRRRPAEGLQGQLGLEATDAGLRWVLSLSPDHLEHVDGPLPVDDAPRASTAVTATASDLLLWLTGRLDASDALIAISGEPTLVATWERSVSFG